MIIGAGNASTAVSVGAVTLTLENVTVRDADGINNGVSCAGGALNLVRTTVTNNGGIGVVADTCPVTMDRSRVSENLRGGVSLTSSGYTITNSFIVDNGRTTAGGSAMGGVLIANPPGGGPTRFDNNTLTGNVAGGGAPSAGIICPFAGSAVPLVNNIVWANGGGVQTAGMCTITNSDVQGIGAGGGNINMDPLFFNAAGADYHITATSPCRNAGNNAGATDHDFDGDPRPRPSMTNVDMGADEVP